MCAFSMPPKRHAWGDRAASVPATEHASRASEIAGGLPPSRRTQMLAYDICLRAKELAMAPPNLQAWDPESSLLLQLAAQSPPPLGVENVVAH